MVISTLGTFRIGTATKGPIAVRAMSWGQNPEYHNHFMRDEHGVLRDITV
jgi:hypothetical protein